MIASDPVVSILERLARALVSPECLTLIGAGIAVTAYRIWSRRSRQRDDRREHSRLGDE